MQTACEAPEEDEQNLLDSASALQDEAAALLKPTFTLLFDDKLAVPGQFVVPLLESICVLEHAQLLADREATWEQCKLRNQWCQALFQMALGCKGLKDQS